MILLKDIIAFTIQSPIAIIGVSENKRKFGNMAYFELKKRNIQIIPVHKELQIFDNQKCYNSIAQLPSEVKAAVLITKSDTIESLLTECSENGITHVWIQQGAEPDNMKEIIEKYTLNIIYKECILMFLKPTGFHKFHSSVKKLFGRYPK